MKWLPVREGAVDITFQLLPSNGTVVDMNCFCAVATKPNTEKQKSGPKDICIGLVIRRRYPPPHPAPQKSAFSTPPSPLPKFEHYIIF